MRHHLFISYRHRDVQIASDIERELTERGFECWRDPRIPWGADFPRVIEQAIDDSQALMVLLSRRAGRSQWVEKEIAMAQAKGRPVLPVMLDNFKLPPPLQERLDRLHRIPVRKSRFKQDIDNLVNELRDLGIGSLEDDIDTGLMPQYVEDAFPELDPFDRDRLDAIAAWAGRRFLGTPCPRFWTVHGLRHTNGVLRHLKALATDRIREHDQFAFCLAAAACLHDAGLVHREIQTQQDEPLVAHERIALPRRTHHHKRSDTLVRSLAGQLRLTAREARITADICHYHNSRTNAQELSQNPDIAELVSIFRIANACDLGPVRAPAFFWRSERERIWGNLDNADDHLHIPNGPTPAREKDAALTFWLRNLMVNEVHIDGDTRQITLCCHAPTSDLFFIPKQIHSYLQRTVEQLASFIGVWTVDFQPVEAAEDTSVLTMEEMVELGARMYSDPQAVLRSSTDIGQYLVRSVVALTDPDHIETVRDSLARNNAGGPEGRANQRVLEKLNGLFDTLPPKRPELHYLQWLTAQFTQTTGRASEDGSSGDKIRRLRQRFRLIDEQRHLYPLFDPTDDRRQCPFNRIASHAYEKLKQVAGDKDAYTMFVFGRSGPVCAFIKYCADAGKRVRVCTPVMRPAAEGPTLKVVDGLHGLHGVRVEVIPDAAIPHALKHGVTAEKQRHDEEDSPNGPARIPGGPCDVALMGCEAILAGPEPAVATSLGALAVAQMASHVECQLWVLSEEAKRHADETVSCWGRKSSNRIGQLPASFFMHEAAASQAAADSAISYPRSEIVPAQLLDLLITESGARPLKDTTEGTEGQD